jgi:hypothetical protein
VRFFYLLETLSYCSELHCSELIHRAMTYCRRKFEQQHAFIPCILHTVVKQPVQISTIEFARLVDIACRVSGIFGCVGIRSSGSVHIIASVETFCQ